MAAPDKMPEGLSQLEDRVHQAAARLRELQTLNARLERRVRELEQRLAGAGAAGTAGDADGAPPHPAERAAWDAERTVWEAERTAWECERSEIRRRIEALVRTLESLDTAPPLPPG